MSRESDGAAETILWAELSSNELYQEVRRIGSSLDLNAIRQILRSAYLEERAILAILEQKQLCASYEVRKLVVASAKTPLARALQWIPGLYWRDLLELARNLKVPPAVRRSAERYLVARLPGMAVGERVSLARLATGLVLNQIRHDHDPRIIHALLENSRITEGLLIPMAISEQTPAEVLRLLAESPRWGHRYVIRFALARNPRTPIDIGLRFLVGLKKIDREAVAGNPRLSAVVRKRANVLLGKSPI